MAIPHSHSQSSRCSLLASSRALLCSLHPSTSFISTVYSSPPAYNTYATPDCPYAPVEGSYSLSLEFLHVRGLFGDLQPGPDPLLLLATTTHLRQVGIRTRGPAPIQRHSDTNRSGGQVDTSPPKGSCAHESAVPVFSCSWRTSPWLHACRRGCAVPRLAAAALRECRPPLHRPHRSHGGRPRPLPHTGEQTIR